MTPGFRKLQSLLPNLAAVSANFGAHGALFQQGEIDIGVQNFNFAEQLKAKGVPIEFVRPTTGIPAWKTSMHVVQGALQPDLAYALIDSQITATVQAAMEKSPWDVIPDQRPRPARGTGRVRSSPRTRRALQAAGVLRLGQREQAPRRLDAAIQPRQSGSECLSARA